MNFEHNTLQSLLFSQPAQPYSNAAFGVSSQHSHPLGCLHLHPVAAAHSATDYPTISEEEMLEEIAAFINEQLEKSSASENFKPSLKTVRGQHPIYHATRTHPKRKLSAAKSEGTDDGYSSSDADIEERGNQQKTRSNRMSEDDNRFSFWQYNSQLKGPRGERFALKIEPDNNDPHNLVPFSDPVFDPKQMFPISHVGKQRKGDGNEVTPNPKRLCTMGDQLNSLNSRILALSQEGDTPTIRKEKNRLASRACRLKKKANHEANRVKLYALRKEHRELNAAIAAVKQKMTGHQDGRLTGAYHKIISEFCKTRAAGNTTQLVDEVVEKVRAGDETGGLLAD